MPIPGRLPSGRIFTIAALGAALFAAGSLSSAALAASCPSVADPQGIETSLPYQLDLPDYEAQMGKQLELSENPMFAEQVKAGKLPPVAERVPQEALVYLPYDDCGKYGGTLRGLAKALESGTSEILSWRQVNFVRLSDDLQTMVPNVAKSWQWNDDYSEITFTLRKGHKWSDGAPFTTEDRDSVDNHPDLGAVEGAAHRSVQRLVRVRRGDLRGRLGHAIGGKCPQTVSARSFQ